MFRRFKRFNSREIFREETDQYQSKPFSIGEQ